MTKYINDFKVDTVNCTIKLYLGYFSNHKFGSVYVDEQHYPHIHDYLLSVSKYAKVQKNIYTLMNNITCEHNITTNETVYYKREQCYSTVYDDNTLVTVYKDDEQIEPKMFNVITDLIVSIEKLQIFIFNIDDLIIYVNDNGVGKYITVTTKSEMCLERNKHILINLCKLFQ